MGFTYVELTTEVMVTESKNRKGPGDRTLKNCSSRKSHQRREKEGTVGQRWGNAPLMHEKPRDSFKPEVVVNSDKPTEKLKDKELRKGY